MQSLKPRPGVLEVKPYIGGEGRAGANVTRLARLASNENPLGCSEAARAAYMPPPVICIATLTVRRRNCARRLPLCLKWILRASFAARGWRK